MGISRGYFLGLGAQYTETNDILSGAYGGEVGKTRLKQMVRAVRWVLGHYRSAGGTASPELRSWGGRSQVICDLTYYLCTQHLVCVKLRRCLCDTEA